ncbi:hypothetical protein LO80_03330 [Candidatus Francisella endociliophora]|uniref:Uncharacterized protein n=1 Tax=Candidatus Francisella endociliophora TaxID=653937 RepID=A0A097ENF3_9GAMM|nr:hypothetical protein [Francisella sp. FSC1006]AIT09096.1 hypothetical protein LO80_03330 [Francisella sp. FSC1006]
MLTGQEVYNLYNQNMQVKDKSIDEYYAENIPYFNGINTFDIANAKGVDVATADDMYNNSDEVELLKYMRTEIPKKMVEAEKSNKFKKVLMDVLMYFARLYERVRASIDGFINEIDNPYHWKNTGDEPPLEPRFIKEKQMCFFDDDINQAEIINKGEIAKKNKKKRISKAVDNLIYQQKYKEAHRSFF